MRRSRGIIRDLRGPGGVENPPNHAGAADDRSANPHRALKPRAEATKPLQG
ncbi:MAG: hypothetical protein AVDCRST_MAG59-2266 [uncultured Thermomicrobiales bacterium]|uniref:Uncharacterized protein n=1 Tax=uncultured Thermomicrobiales bacterium TaxID=1645740 RepID=A0A6J4UQD2_9BACT|nr:MAG: hypothetical protein AVDCRST_MAG59-2266 [uncultured Thermomicrobiales bacterium]